MTREEAIDVLKHDYPSSCFEDLCNAVDIAIKALSAQPEPRWIPTSERLPKVREWVLCQCRTGIMDVLRLTENGYWNKDYLHTNHMSEFVIAWMPLPKSYKEDIR